MGRAVEKQVQFLPGFCVKGLPVQCMVSNSITTCQLHGSRCWRKPVCHDAQVRWLWRFVMMPLLFGLVGASINFATIASGSIGKACAIVLAGSTLPSSCTTSKPSCQQWLYRE